MVRATIDRMMGKPNLELISAAIIAMACTGCLSAAARGRNEPPARLTVGATTRHFAAVQAPTDEPATFRSSTSQPSAIDTDPQTARMAAIAFTMLTGLPGTYLGGEVETGVLDPGKTAASVYGVAGARKTFSSVTVGAELVAGRRWFRYGDDELAVFAVEPRLRADVWLGERLTLGCAVGATLGDRDAVMMGAFLGIHSHDFGASR